MSLRSEVCGCYVMLTYLPDSRIYIWRSNGLLVEALDAHLGCVNSIAWHPTDPSVFASAGDDHKVRIWKPSRAPNMEVNRGSSNGYGR